MAAIAARADSLMIEVHPNPAKALLDGLQSLRGCLKSRGCCKKALSVYAVNR
ncbi:hypothetical protein F8S20_38850 [Nostoc sp. BAE]|nr:hypothetical protein [Nostoc commune BAE]